MTFFAPRALSTADMPTTRGGDTGFGQNYRADLESARRMDAHYALEYEYREALARNRREVTRLTGQAPPEREGDTISLAPYLQRARAYEGEGTLSPELAQEDEAYAALKQKNARVQTPREVFNRLQQQLQAVEARAADIGSRATLSGMIGGFAGAVVGAFSERDPVNVATLGLGGFGKTLAVRVLSEAGVNSAVEAINQFTGVTENRRLLGLETSTEQALLNVAAAGVGAGLLRGGGELGASAVKSIGKKAVELSKLLPSELLQQLRASPAMKERPAPSVRATETALEREAVFEERAKPVGDAIAEQAKHSTAMEAATRALRDEVPEYLDMVPLPTRAEVEAANAQSVGQSPYFEQAREIQRQMAEASLDKDRIVARELGYTPKRLAAFVRERGGLSDVGGEFKARDVTNKRYPGLIRRKGRDIDTIREAAFDAGYFPGKTDYRDITDSELIDAIAADALGDPVIPFEDAQRVAELRDGLTDIDDFAREGFDPDMDVGDIVAELEMRGGMAESLGRIGRVQPESLDRGAEELASYGTVEEQLVQADYAALMRERAEGTVMLETADDEVMTVSMRELMDDIGGDEAALNAFRVCGL